MAIDSRQRFLYFPRHDGGKPFEAVVDARGCHVSTLIPMKLGGQIRATIGGRSWLLHRYLYEQRHGPLDPETVVRQTCGNRACLNDDHHVAEDRYENVEHGPNGEPVFMIPRPGGGRPFKAYVDLNGCHVCVEPAACGAFGHPQAKIRGRAQTIHRALFEDRHGELPDTVLVRHACDNPKCLNDRHHLTGSHDDNVQDRVLRQRSAILERNGRAKLNRAQVLDIFFSTDSPTALAERYGVDRALIPRIWKQTIWRGVTHGLVRPGS